MRKISISRITLILFAGIMISYGQDKNRTIQPIYISSDTLFDISSHEQRTILPIYITSEFIDQRKVIQPVYTSGVINAQLNTTEQITFPSYVSILLLQYKTDEGKIEYGYANAVLIDKENKLFIANSHAINIADSVRIGVKSQWYLAQTREEWTNWKADLAILKIDIDADSLSQPACLAEEIPTRGAPVMLTGYKIEKTFWGEPVITQYMLKGAVNDPYAEWGIYSYDKFQIAALLFLKEKGHSIPKKQLFYLYKDYIHFLLDSNQALPNDPRGLSGSALLVLTKNNCIAGIISGFDNRMIQGFDLPVSEIKLLWEKAVTDLGK